MGKEATKIDEQVEINHWFAIFSGSGIGIISTSFVLTFLGIMSLSNAVIYLTFGFMLLLFGIKFDKEEYKTKRLYSFYLITFALIIYGGFNAYYFVLKYIKNEQNKEISRQVMNAAIRSIEDISKNDTMN